MRPGLALLSHIYTSTSQLEISKDSGCGPSQGALTPISVSCFLVGKSEHIYECNRTEN